MTDNLVIAIITVMIIIILIIVLFHHKYQTKEEREENFHKLWIAIIIAIIVIVCIYVFYRYQTSNATEEYGFKTAVQGVAGKAILKAGGLLDCPKGQKCFCSQSSNTCKFIDKNKVYQEVKQYHDINTCASHCLGKTVEAARKGQIK